jgi:nucleoside-diphosphate-sugar epimerase
VLAGSCAQYDWDAPTTLLSEASSPRRPATLYGRAKQATSDVLEAWAETTGLSLATALIFFPYGPFEQPERLVPSVARSLLAGEPAAVSAGTQVRDFLHVTDCGAALAALVGGTVTGPVNVGSGHGSPVADVARTIARIVGREDLLRIGALPTRDEAPRVVADTVRLRDEVGVVPRYELEDGLRDAVDWWRGRAG